MNVLDTNYLGLLQFSVSLKEVFSLESRSTCPASIATPNWLSVSLSTSSAHLWQALSEVSLRPVF